MLSSENTQTMRILFAGTPEFAVPSLEALCNCPHEVVGLLSRPDRPGGRSRVPVRTDTKEVAMRLGVPVFQPENLEEPGFHETLRDRIAPDMIVVVAYGCIFPSAVLKIPRLGCVNVHASLLPRYRGAAPVNRAIVAGERETGVTTMLMDEGMDTGDILCRKKISIGEDETAGELLRRLSVEGSRLLLQTIERIEKKEITPVKQDEKAASYAPALLKKDGEINWRRSARQIKDLVRGMNPWPSAHTALEGKTIKIFRAVVVSGEGLPGEILSSGGHGIDVATGKGVLRILSLQAEGGRKMEAAEFVRGRRTLRSGQIMGRCSRS